RSVVELARHEPDGERHAAALQERLDQLQTSTQPVRYTHVRTDMPERPFRAFDCTLTPVRDDDTGELQIVLYEIHDRTDSYEAEQRLRRSEERLRALAEAVPQMLWIASAAEGIEYVSPRWTEFTGASAEELLGQGFTRFIHPDDLDAAGRVPERTDGSGPPTVFRLRRHDGVYRWVEARARAIIDPGTGAPIRWFGGTLDVTEQRQAAADAGARQQQLRVALDVTGLGCFELNFREQWMEADARMCEILGLDAGELMHKAGLDGFFDMIEVEYRERITSAVEAAMTPGGPTYDVVYPMLRPGPEGPERRWLAVLGRVDFDDEGAVRMVGVVEDITEKREEDEARVRLQKLEAMGTLAGGIAHDFNNVIGAILSYARVAEAELAAGESPSESISEIARGALRAGDLTKRLLTFARDEPVRQVALDLGDVVDEAASLVRPTLPRGTELAVAVAAGLPPVLGDSTQLHQVMVNLITNAGQALAGRGHGRIDVSVEQVVLGERRTGVVAGLDAGEYLR
ncbi:MAG: PAS domain S-box protein, partial [Solirubrobacteraceae bacterium]|nr:PAS domain S-box protein [Solirubrobacteraceae bacterium]